MADIKYIDYSSIERVVGKVRSTFGTSFDGQKTPTSVIIQLLNDVKVDGKGTEIASVTIDSATTALAGLMSAADKTKLDSIDTSAIGTVKSITPGTGLTGTSTDTAITTVGTINLKPAAADEIGGIKVASVGTAASGANTAVNANKFAVHIDSNGLGYVAIPAYTNNTGDITAVVAGNGLTGGADSGSATLNVGAGTGISVASDSVSVKLASNGERGGIQIGYTQSGKNYPVQLSSEKAYVNVPWTDTKLTTVDFTASAETNVTTDTVAVVTSIPDATGSNGTTVSSTYKTQTVPTTTYVTNLKDRIDDIDTTLSGLSTAMRYIGKSSTAISDGGTQTPTIGGETVTQQQGDVVIDSADKKEYIWNGSAWEEFGNEGNYKVVQVAVPDPTASGISSTFIDTISQDINGKITATKKSVPTYSAGTGITISSDRKISHADTNTNISTDTSYGPDADAQQNAKSTLSFTVPEITLDGFGHVKSATNRTITVTDTNTTYDVVSTTSNGLAPKVTDTSKYLRGDGTWSTPTNTTYSAGTGLTLNGTTFNHTNSVNEGTAGASSASSGSTISVPYVTVNATGHVTAYGNRTHTITGFLTSHQTIKQDGITGATVNRYASCSTAAGTVAKTASISNGTFNLEAGARVTVKFTNANTANSPTLNINGSGAKNIFHKGARITSDGNKALLAGAVDFIYDGTQWHLIGNYIDTDTHYNANIVAGGSTATSNTEVTNPYITIVENNTRRSAVQLSATTTATDTSTGITTLGLSITSNNSGTITLDPGVRFVPITNAEIDALFAS